MMSASLSFNIFSYEVKYGTLRSAPALAARSGSTSLTATSSSPSTFSIASKWFLLMRPAPARAMRNFFSVLNSGCSPQLVALLPIFRAARLTLLRILVGQTLSALAHPADSARRNADHQRVRGYVFRNDASRAHERILVESDAADDRRVGADRRSFAHERPLVFVLARDVAPRIHHVGEDHGRPAEHIVLQHHALVHRDVVLDLDVVADRHAVHHHHVLAKRAPLADDRAAEHVTEVPHLRVCSDLCSIVDVRRLVDEWLRHQTPASRGIRACHSCSESTEGARDRSARIASHAALAADS